MERFPRRGKLLPEGVKQMQIILSLVAATALLLVLAGAAWRRATRRTSTVRVTVLAAPVSRAAPGDLERGLFIYGRLVEMAAQAGARLAVLPADHLTVDEGTYATWLAQVRHWARRGQIWLVLGYRFTGADPVSRVLVIDPGGNIRAACDRATPSCAAYFTGDLSLTNGGVSVVGWRRFPTAGGLWVQPLGPGRWHSLVRLAAQVKALASGSAVVQVGPEEGWVVDSLGRVLRRGSSVDGAIFLVADVTVMRLI